jgi:hypothetical protein
MYVHYVYEMYSCVCLDKLKCVWYMYEVFICRAEQIYSALYTYPTVE